ncbi:IclR family transcriptional regulator C-terminal domain-containing protein [Streptomyces youssoufiensis]
MVSAGTRPPRRPVHNTGTHPRTRAADEPSPPRAGATHTASEPTLISSVQRALRLLEAVGAHEDGAPAKQLAREAGLPLPTAYHLLRTLTHEGYLHRESGLFRYGDAVRRLGAGRTGLPAPPDQPGKPDYQPGNQPGQSGLVPGPADRLARTVTALAGELGVAVYFAVYREGEVDVLATADAPGAPAVEEWADFRQTAHAHAIGQCLLAQLDEAERADHFARYPVRALTPYSVRDEAGFHRRCAARRPLQPVCEREEYALGTVCAAIPLIAGETAATLAVSTPLARAERLRPAVDSLRSRVGALIGSLSFSISI